jgi:acyl-homoserine-lactone acylase
MGRTLRREGRSGERRPGTIRFALVALTLAAALGPLAASFAGSASGSSSQIASVSAASPEGALHATIRRTSHGIPHILADDFAGLGFGYGYAFAQDNLCVLADIYVTVNGERSRYFGPDGTWSQGGNDTAPHNLNSDFFFQRIKDNHTIENLLQLPPPQGPRPEIKEAVRGFVHGYNKYLRDTGVDNLPDASCRGKPWVREISEMDAYRRFYQLGLIASQGVVIDGIGGAQPPAGSAPASPATSQDEIDQTVSALGKRLPLGGIGSNAIALGSDATDNGRGMMLGNPHFPWDGSERFYEAQMTIPGKVNVEGGSLFGVPVINIGHTDNLAWSHTVSTAYRFTPFELRLVSGDPTSYVYDGQVRRMKAEDVTVMVKNGDGSLSPSTRTLYSSLQGPIFNDLLGVPLPWTPATAFAMGDANADNFRYLNHFFEVNMAQSTQELYDILRRNQGVPWVNTIAADSTGQALYADISVVPHVTDEQANACNTEIGRASFAALGLPFLDGSLSTCAWASNAFGGPDPDAIEPGIFGPSQMPHLFRTDYVENSNDSYWLSNPEQPLEGFDRIIGDERTERALRTRSGLVMIEQRLAGTDGWPGNRYTLPLLQDTVFANRQYAGELWRDQLADFCDASPTMTGSSGPVDVSEACPVLRAWDLHDNLDSNGAILFRRFASRLLGLGQGLVTTPGIYTTQFDANDPVHTPNGLNVANPAVEQSFADAVTDLRNAGIRLDAPLRGWQYERRGSERIPIHGGPGGVGVFNAINVQWVGSGSSPGYPNVPHGSSFVMAAQFTGDESCPVDTRTILTYSQSTNPASPWFADQTRMFSHKQWVDEAYCEGEILADPNLAVTDVSDDSGLPYPRAGSASPLRVPLVPGFRQCKAPDAVHAAPLRFPSCKAPKLESNVLTTSSVGKGGGFARFDVIPGNLTTTEDEANLNIAALATDVTKASDGSDYAGKAVLTTLIRITDQANGGTGSDSGTVQDLSFSAPLDCAATPGTSSGGSCSVNTTADALVPGMIAEGKRALVSVSSVELLDAGPDGQITPSGLTCPPSCGTGDESVYLRQGIFAP